MTNQLNGSNSSGREIVEERLSSLHGVRSEHGFRAATLVPDLALLGLVEDLSDAAETALELLGSVRPYRAYMMARIAFEAAQRVLVLATTTEYLALGTRAWLYYQGKDSGFGRSTPVDALPSKEEQTISIWERYCPDARRIVAEQGQHLRTTRRPDNFLRRNMAEAVEEAYRVLATWRGNEAPRTVEADSTLYQVLSRDSHAVVRLEPRSFQIDLDGFVEISESSRDASVIAKTVRISLDISLKEGLTAMEYRLYCRRRQHAEDLRTRVHAAPPLALPPNFSPDLGLELLTNGCGDGPFSFPGVPVFKVGKLADDTLSFMVTTSPRSDARSVTFDFKGAHKDTLRERIVAEIPEVAELFSRDPFPACITLPRPVLLNLTAVFGDLRETEVDRFIPLIVTAIQ